MKSAAPRRPQRRQRLPEAERREQILKAAFDVARKSGLEAVTARSVSQAAGLSPGLVFFHFKTVDHLQIALVDHVVEESLQNLKSTKDYSKLDPADRLPAFLNDRLASFPERVLKGLLELLVETWVSGIRRAKARDHVRAAAERFREAIVPVAALAIAAEPDRFKDIAPETLASLIQSFLLGSAIQAIVDPKRFDHAALAAALRTLLFPTRSDGPSRTP